MQTAVRHYADCARPAVRRRRKRRGRPRSSSWKTGS